jgi:hypothetical protein
VVELRVWRSGKVGQGGCSLLGDLRPLISRSASGIPWRLLNEGLDCWFMTNNAAEASRRNADRLFDAVAGAGGRH